MTTINYYNKNEFWIKITTISLISALLIITMHTINNIKGKFDDSLISINALNYIHWFTRNAVKLFWMISAVLFYRNFNLSKITIKYKSRLKSLIIPYLIWNIIGIILTWCINLIPSIANHINDLVLFYPSLENIIEGVFHYKFNIIFWFIFELILLVILSPLIYILLANKISGIITIVVFYIFSPLIFNNQTIIRGGESWIYYLIAAYVSIHFYRMTQIKIPNKLSIVFIIIAFMLTYY
mgnify:CR=1 FL=1